MGSWPQFELSFEEFLLEDDSPIYLQIIRYIKRGIAAGIICDQEEMPSRRVLSAYLGVNPNTVQKAYRILEEEGLVSSHSGARSYIHLEEGRGEEVRRQLLQSDTREWITGMKQMGLEWEEVRQMAERLWEEVQ